MSRNTSTRLPGTVFLDSFSGALADLPKDQRTSPKALHTLSQSPRVSTWDRSEHPWVDKMLRDLVDQGLITEAAGEAYPWHRYALTELGKKMLKAEAQEGSAS